MSPTALIAPPTTRLSTLPLDNERGANAMWMVIITEAALFACMFGAYYYLGNNKDRWAIESPPDLMFPFSLLAVIVISAIVLYIGGRSVSAGRIVASRIALWITFVLGLGFIALTVIDFFGEWKMLSFASDSYGSIFYTIVSLHLAHVVLGVFLLGYIGVQPQFGDTSYAPHRPYHTIALYWYFDTVLWIVILILLYIIPHFLANGHGH